MTRQILEDNYSRIVQAIKAMLQAQAEYFQACRYNYGNKADKLLKSKAAEVAARAIFKELYNNYPVIIEHEIKDIIQEYVHFIERSKVLLVEQFRYFADTRDHKQLKKCKALEKEMKEHIKKYLQKQNNQQPTLL